MKKGPENLNSKEEVKNTLDKKPETSPKPVKEVKKKAFITGHLLVGFINLVLIIVTFLILSNLSTKAADLKKIKNEELDALASLKVQPSDLEIKSNTEKIDKLNKLFPNESGLVNFVKEIEKLKTGGIIKGISFVSQEPVRDKTKYLGIPFVIEAEGSWEQIDASLGEIQKLPFLIRAVTVEVNVIDANLVNFKYGGFIYVDESLAKNR